MSQVSFEPYIRMLDRSARQPDLSSWEGNIAQFLRLGPEDACLGPVVREDCLAFCAAYLKHLTDTQQYALAQRFVRQFVMRVAHLDIAIVWLVFKAFRANPGVRDHVRQRLPGVVSFWLAAQVGNTIAFSDLMELHDQRGVLDQFDWLTLARTCRSELEHVQCTTPAWLPDYLWTVVKATWRLLDADAELALLALCVRVEADGYASTAKNHTAFTLAAAATRNFVPVEELEAAQAAEPAVHATEVHMLNPGDADVACCGGAGGR
jgi:hypothetical protein